MRNIIITPYSYNENTIELLNRCIKSVESQYAEDILHLVIVDNYPPGGMRCSSKIEEGFIRAVCSHNTHGILENIVYALDGFFPIDNGDLITILLGEDRLNMGSLRNLNAIYKALPNTWISTGGFKTEKPCALYSVEINFKSIRKGCNWIMPPLTFRYGLFEKIPKEYFQKKGEFFKHHWDLALAWPMLEVSGESHYKEITLPLYVLNNDTAVISNQEEERYIRDMYPLFRIEAI
jgi:hypothetical protein